MFTNRASAGRQLANQLLRFRAGNPMVLALPRGGVPVAFEVAEALGAPLDLLLVRKIGAPGQPELAVGAVVDGNHAEVVVNEDVRAALAVPQSFIDDQTEGKLKEIEERRRLYLRGRPRLEPAGRQVIVIDDGIATGATIRAALKGLRRAGPAKLICAAPVAPPDTIEDLRQEVDEVICLLTPAHFGAIGWFYEDFTQVTDAEVIALLDRAARRSGAD